jgi:hypothetical protein
MASNFCSSDRPDTLLLTQQPIPERRRRDSEEEDGIQVCDGLYPGVRMVPDIQQVIQYRDLKLTGEIGSGPGYFFHSGQAKGRAVIVKVFNAGPTVREVSYTYSNYTISYLKRSIATGGDSGSVEKTTVCESSVDFSFSLTTNVA